MPLVDHPTFDPPGDHDRLWRYIDLAKYLSLITTRSLWFSRADLLGDPFEGSVPRLNPELRAQGLSSLDEQERERAMKSVAAAKRDFVRYMYVNCWHCSEWESAAMWRLYMADHGIAILSDLERFRQAFGGDDQIHVGRVGYIDYETEVISEGNMFTPFVFKRRSFRHEEEVRAVFMKLPMSSRPGDETTHIDYSLPTQPGIRVPADPALLIAEVHVAPDAPSWFADVVEDVTRRYGFEYNVSQSDLDGTPVH